MCIRDSGISLSFANADVEFDLEIVGLIFSGQLQDYFRIVSDMELGYICFTPLMSLAFAPIKLSSSLSTPSMTAFF